ncbi:MAG: SGNH/GDSL hydrolase family protein, partial [bacterium]|nr:SGNH/GDSL hydrolase family protein [bacterium]
DPTILRHFLKTRSFVFNLLDTSFGRVLTTLRVRLSPLEEETRQLYSGENLARHQGDLRAFIRMTKERNIPLMIIHFPFLYRLDRYPFADITQMVKGIATEEQVPFLDLTDALSRHPTDDLVIDWSDAHPNGRANRLAADAITRYVTMRL